MGTELRVLSRHAIVEFWGGDTRGKCLQVTVNDLKTPEEWTAEAMLQVEGFITLNEKEARELRMRLGEWLKED